MPDAEKKLLNLANSLTEISYTDWMKLRFLVDRAFDAEKRKMERQLHLPPVSEQDLMRL